VPDKKNKKKDERTRYIHTLAARDSCSPEGHLYQSMLRGWEPPTERQTTSFILAGTQQNHMPKKRSLQEKEAKRMEHAEKHTEEVHSPEADKEPWTKDPQRPTHLSHAFSRIGAEYVGARDEKRSPDKIYRMSKRSYYATIAKSPQFFTSDQVVGRTKPVFPPRDWERGCDGHLSTEVTNAVVDVKKGSLKKAVNISKTTGRDANVQLMTNLQMEPVPDTIYKYEPAQHKTKNRMQSVTQWNKSPSRQQERAAHRFAAGTHWARQASLLRFPDRDESRMVAGDYDPDHDHVKHRPHSIADFRAGPSRTQVFLQSNDDSNNTAQVAAGHGLGQHFSSQGRLRSPRDKSGAPPYSALNEAVQPRSHVPGKQRGYETPTLTTPIVTMGRTERDVQSRALISGGACGHIDFDLIEDRKRWRPADGKREAPGPDAYTPNHDSVKTRTLTTDFHKTATRCDTWGPAGSASHLEPRSPDPKAILPRSLGMKMNKGVRNTSMVLRREGCDTSYSPRDVNGNPGASPVRIGAQAGREKHSGNRFENQYATPGDFMPKPVDTS